MMKYIRIAAFTVFMVTTIASIILYNKNKALSNSLSVAMSNQKAYVAENSSLKESNKVFQLTIDQLEYYNDSILHKMNAVREGLKIKDKNLKQIQYLSSTIAKTDTVVFRDTLFREPSLSIDTIIGDEWYNMGIHLKYPSSIIVSPKFNSEKYIVTNYKKETINPPKKFWLFRLFQKKHKVIEVNVVEKSPYIENKQQKFIEIIK